MSSADNEFLKVLRRFLKAKEYFNEMYPTDTAEGQEWAENTFLHILYQMCGLWNQMTDDEKLKYSDLLV